MKIFLWNWKKIVFVIVLVAVSATCIFLFVDKKIEERGKVEILHELVEHDRLEITKSLEDNSDLLYAMEQIYYANGENEITVNKKSGEIVIENNNDIKYSQQDVNAITSFYDLFNFTVIRMYKREGTMVLEGCFAVVNLDSKDAYWPVLSFCPQNETNTFDKKDEVVKDWYYEVMFGT
jgi:hypothetical protein